jgi:hypothetical protein
LIDDTAVEWKEIQGASPVSLPLTFITTAIMKNAQAIITFVADDHQIPAFIPALLKCRHKLIESYARNTIESINARITRRLARIALLGYGVSIVCYRTTGAASISVRIFYCLIYAFGAVRRTCIIAFKTIYNVITTLNTGWWNQCILVTDAWSTNCRRCASCALIWADSTSRRIKIYKIFRLACSAFRPYSWSLHTTGAVMNSHWTLNALILRIHKVICCSTAIITR